MEKDGTPAQPETPAVDDDHMQRLAILVEGPRVQLRPHERSRLAAFGIEAEPQFWPETGHKTDEARVVSHNHNDNEEELRIMEGQVTEQARSTSPSNAIDAEHLRTDHAIQAMLGIHRRQTSWSMKVADAALIGGFTALFVGLFGAVGSWLTKPASLDAAAPMPAKK